MVQEMILEGNWNEIKGKIRRKWGELTENDFAEAKGNVEELVGIIQRKTGEGREAVESYLRQINEGASSVLGAAAEKAREYVHQAGEGVEHARKQTIDQIQAGYAEAQRMVRDQPGASLGLCFGLGVLTGIVIGLTLRTR